MNDFAKIFVVDGIGQILVTTGLNDDGDACLTFRIPDAPDCLLETSKVPAIADQGRAELIVARMFAETDEATAIKSVSALISARNQMLECDE